jgi:hypothetical protein
VTPRAAGAARLQEFLIDVCVGCAIEQAHGDQAVRIEIAGSERLAVIAFEPHETADRQRLRRRIERDLIRISPRRARAHATAFFGFET